MTTGLAATRHAAASKPLRVAVSVIAPAVSVDRMATRLMPHSVSSQRLFTEFTLPLF